MLTSEDKRGTKMSKMKKKNRHIGRKILFGVEILVLVLLVGALFVYAQINKKMDKLNLKRRRRRRHSGADERKHSRK